MALTLWLQWLLISAKLENRKEAGMLYDSALRWAICGYMTVHSGERVMVYLMTRQF